MSQNKEARHVDRYILIKVGNLYVEKVGIKGVSLVGNVSQALRFNEYMYEDEPFIDMLVKKLNEVNQHGLKYTLVRETITKAVDYDDVEIKAIGNKLVIRKEDSNEGN